jgi:hypothetical protein
LTPDDEGFELPTLQRVQEEAARSLADMARDAVIARNGNASQEMAIEVRDDNGPVFRVSFTFKQMNPRTGHALN